MTRWLFFDSDPVVVSALNSVGLDAIEKSLLEMTTHRPWRFLVTPGNSFGIMDGGFDAAVLKCFGKDVQKHVQEAIRKWHGGLCPVGSCVVAPLPQGRWLIYTPTMEVPQSIRYSLNVFWAMRAAAIRVRINWSSTCKEGEVALCPGLGTLTGKMSPAAAAFQIYAALELDSLKADTWNKAVACMEKIDRMKSVT